MVEQTTIAPANDLLTPLSSHTVKYPFRPYFILANWELITLRDDPIKLKLKFATNYPELLIPAFEYLKYKRGTIADIRAELRAYSEAMIFSLPFARFIDVSLEEEILVLLFEAHPGCPAIYEFLD